MAKYKINQEFFPFSLFAPPIQSAKMAGRMGSKMRPPRWVRKNRDHEVSVTRETLKSYDGADISVFDYTKEGFCLTDKAGNHIASESGYRCILTVADGEVVYRAQKGND